MKNTIVKLLMALAMCFVIGGSLIACAGADGAKGEKGDKGDKGDAPKVTINADGFWCVDGESTGVKAQGEKGEGVEACEHDLKLYELVPHYIVGQNRMDGSPVFAPGDYLEYCTKCNAYAKVIEGEVIHIPEEEGREIAATCTAPSSKGIHCATCQTIIEQEEGYVPTPALGHKDFEFKAVENTPYNVCLEGGLVMARCTRENCGYVETKFEDLHGHKVTEWKLADLNATPKYDGTDVATGECEDCDATVNVTLPALTNAGSVNKGYKFVYKNGVEPTCIKGANEIWSYTLAEADVAPYYLRANYTTIANIYDKEVSPNGRQLGYYNENGELVGAISYDKWAEQNYIGKNSAAAANAIPRFVNVGTEAEPKYVELAVAPLGSTTEAPKEYKCDESLDSYFMCADPACKDSADHGVVSVKVFSNHYGIENNHNEAVCYDYIKSKVKCLSECNKFVESETPDYKIDHKFEYTIELNETETANAGYRVFNVYKKCVNDWKHDNVTEKCWQNTAATGELCGYDEFTITEDEIVVLDANGSKIDRNSETWAGVDGFVLGYTVQSSCYELGYTNVQYENSNVLKLAAEKCGSHTIVVNGKTMLFNDYKAEVGVVTNKTPGILELGEKDYSQCGVSVDAAFICPVCQEKGQNYIITEPVISAHKFDLTKDPDATLDPTCTEKGYKHWYCINENCPAEKDITGAWRFEEDLEKLGHDFGEAGISIKKDANTGREMITLPTDTANGYVTWTATCTREKCSCGNAEKLVEFTATLLPYGDEANKVQIDSKTGAKIYKDENGYYFYEIDGDATGKPDCFNSGKTTYVYTVNFAEMMSAANADEIAAKLVYVEAETAKKGHQAYDKAVHGALIETKAYHDGGLHEDVDGKYDIVMVYVCKDCGYYVAYSVNDVVRPLQ